MNETPMTATDLIEIRRLHVLWLEGNADGKRANLRHADLRGANLRGANLSGANLRYADLRYADLRGANLRYANLRGANLSGANLRYADLNYADLSGANLSGANLRHADLSYANLRGADLSGANLSGANLRHATGFINGGYDLRGYPFHATQNRDGVIIVRAGCHEFVGIAAARAHWTERHVDNPILHADCLSLVDRIERMAAVRGWQLEPTTKEEMTR